MSCHNIFVDWVTHEKIFYDNFSDTSEKRSTDEGLAARLPRLSGTLEAAVSQELVNEKLGMPQTGNRVHYGSKERNDYWTLTARQERATMLVYSSVSSK